MVVKQSKIMFHWFEDSSLQESEILTLFQYNEQENLPCGMYSAHP